MAMRTKEAVERLLHAVYHAKADFEFLRMVMDGKESPAFHDFLNDMGRSLHNAAAAAEVRSSGSTTGQQPMKAAEIRERIEKQGTPAAEPPTAALWEIALQLAELNETMVDIRDLGIRFLPVDARFFK